MKSRLVREGEDEQAAAWQRQRERIAQNAALWQEAHQWVARNDRSDWPERVADLFPARILPIAAYRRLRQKNTDITLLYRCDAPPELIAPPGSLLHVGTRTHSADANSIAVTDANLQLRMELAQLTQDVAELELELATAQAEVGEFTRRYYELVGRRMVELDALQARLASAQAQCAPDDPRAHAEAQDRQERAEQSARESARFTQASVDEPAAFRPSSDVKRMFRQLAQKITPTGRSTKPIAPGAPISWRKPIAPIERGTKPPCARWMSCGRKGSATRPTTVRRGDKSRAKPP
jgi:hypothetical protein